jgi:CRISPR/Cas system-associated exonuclease Cas4 (RecB family)
VNEKPIRLSKSQYVKGRQCLRKVWLYNHKKELMDKPSEFQELLFSQGNDVGNIAKKVFPIGVEITQKYNEVELALEKTNEAIASGTEVIFEAAFMFDDVLVRADIIKKNKDNSWDLLEVKSSSSWKKVHCLDLAVQTYILKNSGLNIRSSSIMHLNKEYTRGDSLDLVELFEISNLDEEIAEELKQVPKYLEEIKSVISKKKEPEADIGSICKSPYECEFKSTCWKNIGENSIHKLTRINDKKRADLIEIGAELITDIPDGFKLSDSQQIQVTSAKNNSEHIETSPIIDILSELTNPLYHLDFETLPSAVPQFKGYRPYQHYTFQYSLHVEHESKLDHHEYLMNEIKKPKELLEDLIKNIGKSGSVIVYNATFEKQRLLELAVLFPEFTEDINNIVDRLWDLMTPFQKKWYYSPEFYGSYSIKYVLPAMDKSLSYKDLEIRKGDQAIAGFLKFIEETDEIKKTKIKNNLLEYCKLDTYSMVVILRELQNKVKDEAA